MTIRQIVTAADISKLNTMLADWLEGDSPKPKDAQRILGHPFVATNLKNFRQSKAAFIYRTFPVLDFVKDSRPIVTPSKTGVVCYSESKNASMSLAQEMNRTEQTLVCFRKKLTKADLLLNLASVVKAVEKEGYNLTDMLGDEKEVWMRPTPYYTTFNFFELVRKVPAMESDDDDGIGHHQR